MHEPETATTSAEIQTLRNEIEQWALGIRCVFVVLNMLPLYYCTRLLLMVPKAETIYEDMLGSVQRVPLTTQVVLRYWPGLLLLVWLLAMLCIVLIFVLKKPRFVWITAMVSLFFMIAAWHVAASVLLDPLLQIITNLSGGSV